MKYLTWSAVGFLGLLLIGLIFFVFISFFTGSVFQYFFLFIIFSYLILIVNSIRQLFIKYQNKNNQIVEVLESRNKKFFNYTTITLIILNIILFIFLIIMNNVGWYRLKWDVVVLIPHLILVLFSIPLTVLAFVGKYRKTSLVFAIITSLVPIIYWIYYFTI